MRHEKILISVDAPPKVVLVSPVTRMPRFWATAWSIGIKQRALSENTLKLRLRHIGHFYAHCDSLDGEGALDSALGDTSYGNLKRFVETYFYGIRAKEEPSTADVQRWDTVKNFTVDILAVKSKTHSDRATKLAQTIKGMSRLRSPRQGGFAFARALPDSTLRDLLEVANPDSPRNPVKSISVRWRNWLILHLLLQLGLRRGEMLLLKVDC